MIMRLRERFHRDGWAASRISRWNRSHKTARAYRGSQLKNKRRYGLM